MTSIDFSKIGFIIGAGAHVPYGMPISSSLTSKIKSLNLPRRKITILEDYGNDIEQSFIDKKAIGRLIREMKIVPHPHQGGANSYDIAIGDEIDKFLDAFAGSQVYSVDAFLAKYIEENKIKEDDTLIKVGKVILTFLIAKSENERSVGYHDFNWIDFIINEYLKDKISRDMFFEHPPTIYTFNYDRLLERKLFNHIVYYHFYKSEEAHALMRKLNIKHIYGDLDDYNNEINLRNPDQINKAISRIQVIGDDRAKSISSLQERLFNDLKNLKRVYILGYGFDSLNNEVLFGVFKRMSKNMKTTVPLSGSHPITEVPEFVCTNIGLSPQVATRIQNEYAFIDLNIFPASLNEIDSAKLLEYLKPINSEFGRIILK